MEIRGAHQLRSSFEDAGRARMDPEVVTAFEAYDTDNSGTIDAAELGHALKDIGLVVDSGQIGYMLRKYDDDRNATLDLSEFGQLVADLKVNTPESIQARLGLRSHPRVIEALDGWWSAACRSMRREREQQQLPELPPSPSLDEAQYTLIMKKIFKAMVEKWDAADASATASEDWEHDRRGQVCTCTCARTCAMCIPHAHAPLPFGEGWEHDRGVGRRIYRRTCSWMACLSSLIFGRHPSMRPRTRRSCGSFSTALPTARRR